MKIILTVTGLDHEGIIAAVTAQLSEHHVNIENVSQTIMDGYFTMILQGTFKEDSLSITDLQGAMAPIAEDQGVQIRIQSDAIFQAMHTL
ncbi:ACT domain-containing protein [uncultured Rothia sp.]|uniref:ACT domain-containing protein n=1 Tax=uncultured Rothia sp. TaxID=316088 RepID=UPI0032174CC5